MSQTAKTCQPGDEGPVTVSVSRKVRPGREAEYEAWIHEITQIASRFEGHQGINVLRPSAQTNDEYVTIYRFDSYQHGRQWEQSPERKVQIEKLEGLVEGDASYTRVTGLEFWFEFPQVSAAAKPSPHKMAVTLIVVVFSLIYPMQVFIGPQLAGWPLWCRILLFVTLQVLLMTYIVMPRITYMLRRWLYDVS